MSSKATKSAAAASNVKANKAEVHVKSATVAEVKSIPAASDVKRAKKASKNPDIVLSLAETIRLPYPPTNFKRRDMRRIVANVKKARG